MAKTFEHGKEEIIKLTEYFRTNRGAFFADGVKEAQVRQNLIDPLFEALGWDTTNQARVAPQYREVMVEESLDVEGQRKAPDYAFRVGMSPRFYAEAKKCITGIKENAKAAFQLRRYAWSGKTPLSILLNFEEMAVYDCSIKPHIADKADRRRIYYFVWRDYAARWEELWNIFSREAVWSGKFDSFAEARHGRRGTATVDKEFLREIERWRDELARGIARGNPEISEEDLNRVVQLTIDRIIFLRMAEDRRLENYESLLEISQRDDIYRRFIFGPCQHADSKYNSGLFDLTADRRFNNIVLEDKILRPILKSLYFKYGSPYEFRAMPAQILGTVYERFLSRTITLTPGHRARIEEKPEVRKASGVYYTPAYIVEYIVQSTVRKAIEGKPPDQLFGQRHGKDSHPFRVLDLACGSGSFLLGAYQCLMDYYLEWYISRNPDKWARRSDAPIYKNGISEIALLKHVKPKAAVEGVATSWRLTIQEKKRILMTHIFGVDIDHQAVEVTKLSLLLKVLEEENDASLIQQIDWINKLQRALPNLNENIKCGNSLIGPELFTGDLTCSMDDKRHINAFNWDDEFPDAMQTGGFDCIIGNPPYLNIDDVWGKGDIRLRAIKSLYGPIYNDKTDLLFYFLAKAVDMSRGSVGYIISRAFLEAYKADKLRSYLLSHACIEEIIDFQNYNVFPGIGIATCILLLRKSLTHRKFPVYKLHNADFTPVSLAVQKSDLKNFKIITINQSLLKQNPWIFSPKKETSINKKIDERGVSLGDILIIGQGMQTGRNSIFGNIEKQKLVEWKVPKHLYRKRAANSDIQRYYIKNREEYILFLENIDSFSDLPRGIQNYLHTHEAALKQRAAFKRGDCAWWKFTWPLHKEYYSRSRIISPYLAPFNRFALDADNAYLSLTDTTVLFDNQQSESLLYILALLNSKLLSFRFTGIGKLKGAGIYEYFWNSVSNIPIKRINFSDAAETEKYKHIMAKANEIISLNQQLDQARNQNDKALINRHISSADNEINTIVYQLYAMDIEEINIVEESWKSFLRYHSAESM
ncbi:MAG: N-6 DNA methylase [Candidatus Sumerlaeota bacterium]|nr:N-6 DNA methylase [Candidatus Sumerlaeota bacterium]